MFVGFIIIMLGAGLLCLSMSRNDESYITVIFVVLSGAIFLFGLIFNLAVAYNLVTETLLL